MSVSSKRQSHLCRYYIDTRPLLPPTTSTTTNAGSSSHDRKPRPDTPAPDLPLLKTLRQSEQESITRFYRVQDKYMSLASTLLKYWFIHRVAQIAWSEVVISRTPKPHNRPYWDPTTVPSWNGQDTTEPDSTDGNRSFQGLEFNVSHQAGLVVLMGCTTPRNQNAVDITPLVDDKRDYIEMTPQEIRLGVDITCTNEDRRTTKDMTTKKYEEWVDIFEEMFSKKEIRDMKSRDVSSFSRGAGHDGAALTDVASKMRLFYSYWACKEAYIKMVGEGLLASWLKQLEFVDVIPPQPVLVGKDNASDQMTNDLRKPEKAGQPDRNPAWTDPSQAVRSTKILFSGKPVEDVDLELVSFRDNYIIATATRGANEAETSTGKNWVELVIDTDIRPCAEGRCSCLD